MVTLVANPSVFAPGAPLGLSRRLMVSVVSSGPIEGPRDMPLNKYIFEKVGGK